MFLLPYMICVMLPLTPPRYYHDWLMANSGLEGFSQAVAAGVGRQASALLDTTNGSAPVVVAAAAAAECVRVAA